MVKNPRQARIQAADKVPSKANIWQFAQKAESYVSTHYAGVKGAQPPLQKKRCHSEGASADDFAPEESRADRVVPRAARCWRSGLYSTDPTKCI